MALVLALAVVTGVSVLVVDLLHRPSLPSACVFGAGSGTASFSITPDQAQNAAIIAAVAARRGMPDHAVTVALAAALQESKLRNLDYGDRDSLGLFQQRPSQGWGTPTQIMDPAYAADTFYQRLVSVPGWEMLPVGQVAQAVQLSAAPNAYGPWEGEGRALAEALTGEIPAGLSCQLAGWRGVAPKSAELVAAATTEFGSGQLDVTLDLKRGWQVACWAVAHAYNYHLSTVSFDGRIWDMSSGRWHDGASRDLVVRVS